MAEVRPASEMADNADAFVERAREALATLEAFRDRLRSDSEFRDLWSRDSAEALRQGGIDPDARTELGLPPYHTKGPECEWCVTPNGNACHC
jgi:hypothetical protein